MTTQIALLDRPETVDDLTRRELLAGAATLLVASGCGERERTGGNGAALAPAGPSTYRITNQFGTFDVPADPKRVIVLEGRRDLETTLALGLRPIAVGSNAFLGDGKVPAWLSWDGRDGAGTDVARIDRAAINLEQVAALRPDLIIGREVEIKAHKEAFVRLAPMVPVDGGLAPWRPEFESIGRALGRQDHLIAALGGYDRALADVRTRRGPLLTSATLAIVQFNGKEFFSSRAGGFRLQINVLAELSGRHLPWLDAQPLDEFGSSKVSIEQVENLAPADAIVAVVNDEDLRRDLAALELWRRPPAVAAGRVLFTDSRTNYGSVFAARESLRLIDQAYGLIR